MASEKKMRQPKLPHYLNIIMHLNNPLSKRRAGRRFRQPALPPIFSCRIHTPATPLFFPPAYRHFSLKPPWKKITILFLKKLLIISAVYIIMKSV